METAEYMISHFASATVYTHANGTHLVIERPGALYSVGGYKVLVYANSAQYVAREPIGTLQYEEYKDAERVCELWMQQITASIKGDMEEVRRIWQERNKPE